MFEGQFPFGSVPDPNDTAQVPEKAEPIGAKICVMGVGGAGNNAINNMIDSGISNVKFVAVNTDAQILACNKAPTHIQIGSKGLGAGAEPEIGREAAEESKDELSAVIDGTDLLFITAGMGGGTGTGAAPVIAKIAKDRKILTVAVVTLPFSFEGKHRMDNATKGIDNLRKYVDTIIIVPNDKIIDVIPKSASVPEALRVADNVLKQGIRGIADVITLPALINLDFADVRTVLKDKGLAYMGVGVAKGENRIVEAVRLAVNSPLLETTIVGATSILINITGGNDLTLLETRAANELIHGMVDYNANIIFGVCIDSDIQEEVEVTVIATGFPTPEKEAEQRARTEQTTYQPPVQSRPVSPVRPQQAPQQPQPPQQPYPYGIPRSQYGGAVDSNAEPKAESRPTPIYREAPAYSPAPEQAPVQEETPAPASAQPAQPAVPPRAYAPEPEQTEEEPQEDPRDRGIPLFIRHIRNKNK